jgi:hypothetical protein
MIVKFRRALYSYEALYSIKYGVKFSHQFLITAKLFTGWNIPIFAQII